MRTKGRGAPDADSPWNEIVPRLWMGGHQHRSPAGIRTPAVVGYLNTGLDVARLLTGLDA